MIWLILGAAFCGMIIGWAARAADEETCPRSVLGYNCMGSWCDHRKSELYRAHLSMALNEEEREAKKDTNLWGGGE